MSDQKEIEKKNKEIVRRYWDAKWNLRSPEKLDELQAPDVVYHSPSMDIDGLEEYKQVYGMYAIQLKTFDSERRMIWRHQKRSTKS
jgi:hypothetical protein